MLYVLRKRHLSTTTVCCALLLMLSSLLTMQPKIAFAQAALTVERSLTAQNGYEKTTFNAGDAIWYAVIVRNSGPPISVEFTWQATNLAVPNDSSQYDREIFSDKNTVTVQTGVYTIYSPGTVPPDTSGPYWNKETVTVNGQTMARQSQFSVTGGAGCMFNAPDAVIHVGDTKLVGHVGWAFKISTGDAWEYGATEGIQKSDNWIEKGTWAQMLTSFRSRPQYTQYTCRPWPWIWSNPSAADKEARDAQKRNYNLWTDNCLFRSVAALQHYGMTTLLDVLPTAIPQTPNDYFNQLPDLYKTEGGPPTRWAPITRLR
jgi:hypothetical protein